MSKPFKIILSLFLAAAAMYGLYVVLIEWALLIPLIIGLVVIAIFLSLVGVIYTTIEYWEFRKYE